MFYELYSIKQMLMKSQSTRKTLKDSVKQKPKILTQMYLKTWQEREILVQNYYNYHRCMSQDGDHCHCLDTC